MAGSEVFEYCRLKHIHQQLPYFLFIFAIQLFHVKTAGSIVLYDTIEDDTIYDSVVQLQPSLSSNIDSSQIDTSVSNRDTLSLGLLYWVGGFGVTITDIRRSAFGSLRYNSVGLGLGVVTAQEFPPALNDVPSNEDLTHDIRFRSKTTGLDVRGYYDLSITLSAYASLGYYWNNYTSFARDNRTGVYYREERGHELQVTAGCGIIYDIDAGWPRSWAHYAVGVELHSARGVSLVLGFGRRDIDLR